MQWSKIDKSEVQQLGARATRSVPAEYAELAQYLLSNPDGSAVSIDLSPTDKRGGVRTLVNRAWKAVCESGGYKAHHLQTRASGGAKGQGGALYVWVDANAEPKVRTPRTPKAESNANGETKTAGRSKVAVG